MSETRFEIHAIGTVESPLTDPESAPKQGDEGSPEAWLVFDQGVLDGLDGIRVGDEVIVITWLDRADAMCSVSIPAGTRRDLGRAYSPPALLTARIPSDCTEWGSWPSRDARLRVRDLEALDGTPIVDVKPVLSEDVWDR